MTITANDTRNEYTATAGQTVFSYTFKIFEDTDVIAYVTPTGQEADDTTDEVTVLSVTGTGDEDGGTVTLDAVTLDYLVTIVSNIPENRTTDYQNNGDFVPDTVNDDFDRVVSLVKQIGDIANRSIVSQESQQGVKPLTLPAPSALDYIRWKTDESGFENVDLASFGSPTTSDLVTYNLGATGAVDRTVEERLQERVSIKDFGAVGDGSTDDLAAIVSALSDNRTLYFPAGTYNISDTLTITNERLKLVGESTTSSRINLVNADLTKDAVVFTMTDPGIAFDYADSNGISTLGVIASGSKTAGAGVKLIKQNGFKCRDLTILNCPFGLQTYGLSNANITGYSAFGTNTVYSATSSLFSVHAYQNTDLSYQVPFTNTFDGVTIGGSGNIAFGVHITCTDGIRLDNMYIANVEDALVKVDSIPTGTVVGGVKLDNSYLDGVSPTTGVTEGIHIEADADGSMVYMAVSNSTITNCKSRNIYLVGSKIQQINFGNVNFRNCVFSSITASNPAQVRLNVTGSTFHNNSTGSTEVINVNGVKSYNITGNTFNQDSVIAGIRPMLTGGTIVNGVFSSNSIVNFDTDNGRGATYTGGYEELGNNFSDATIFGNLLSQNTRIGILAASPGLYSGAGSPEGVVTAVAGSLYLNSTGGAGVAIYTKESGVGNTGWVAK